MHHAPGLFHRAGGPAPRPGAAPRSTRGPIHCQIDARPSGRISSPHTNKIMPGSSQGTPHLYSVRRRLPRPSFVSRANTHRHPGFPRRFPADTPPPPPVCQIRPHIPWLSPMKLASSNKIFLFHRYPLPPQHIPDAGHRGREAKAPAADAVLLRWPSSLRISSTAKSQKGHYAAKVRSASPPVKTLFLTNFPPGYSPRIPSLQHLGARTQSAGSIRDF